MPLISQPIALIILDGFGHNPNKKYNAVDAASMPYFKQWLKDYPHAILQASGKAVGLPEGFVGNSKVGHLTMGAGRIITQDLMRINNALQDGSFYTNPELVNNFTQLALSRKNLHIMGLLSDGGVHSHINHLYALLKMAKTYKINTVFVHAFLDGRDVAPQSATQYLKQLDAFMQKLGCGVLGSITGRYFAMDRDNNWLRTEKCYSTLTQEQPAPFGTWHEALDYYYAQNITDEFIPPTQLIQNSSIHNHDGIVFFNFRPDRARQVTQAFIDPQFNHFQTKKYNLAFFITMSDYDQQKYPTQSLFKRIKIPKTLKEILNNNGISMFSIAETEKYAHITYFFNGMHEEKLPLETRVLIKSLPRKNYKECPEMSAEEITSTVLGSLKNDPKDFYLINYANADMVGHSGDFNATVQACDFLDTQLKRLYDKIVNQMNGTIIITGDHGKAEDMYDPQTKQPRTAHTTNPVYFVVITKELKDKKINLPLDQLSDIAPYILSQMELPVPVEMK